MLVAPVVCKWPARESRSHRVHDLALETLDVSRHPSGEGSPCLDPHHFAPVRALARARVVVEGWVLHGRRGRGRGGVGVRAVLELRVGAVAVGVAGLGGDAARREELPGVVDVAPVAAGVMHVAAHHVLHREAVRRGHGQPRLPAVLHVRRAGAHRRRLPAAGVRLLRVRGERRGDGGVVAA